ncbi:MAG: DNA double-strand break repair nuclease NurA [Anaerolineae bacterium]|nr:DNA double-strand break repair nuclease NurA [Anaerolineae bacterium]
MADIPRPFGELPMSLVEKLLDQTEQVGEKLVSEFVNIKERKQDWRNQLQENRLIKRESDLPFTNPPTTCGIDGAYAVERLLASDLVVAAAVGVEGITPPSEPRFWEEPDNSSYITVEPHEAEVGSILRGIAIGMELILAIRAPHNVIFIDGSLITPIIHLNQAINKAIQHPELVTSRSFLKKFPDIIESYKLLLTNERTDKCWVGIAKYTSNTDISTTLSLGTTLDDKALLSLLLEPGEYSQPRKIASDGSWHINNSQFKNDVKVSKNIRLIEENISSIHILYYRPYGWLPAIRIESNASVVSNKNRLSQLLMAIKHQCSTPSIMEPYPLYMADRMVKHISEAIPTFRQVSTQSLAEQYDGDLNDVFMGLHSYRTESGR